jgi:tRNA(adenine34) deaminase
MMNTALETSYEHWMLQAMELAREAMEDGDVPVGALVIAQDGTVLGRGRNRRERDGDPTGHAEIVALRDAATHVGSWRLDDTTLFVTLEPCVMCAGALVNARVKRVVYGADDPKAGAVKSLYAVTEDPRLNHRLEVVSGVLSRECGGLLSAFFQKLRKARKGEAPNETMES